MNRRITVVDYGLGNLHSVHKALTMVATGWKVNVSSRSEDIVSADKVVFPGVGAIGACIDGLKERSLDQAIIEAAKTKPMLAICVGFQALFADNEEDTSVRGLDILPGRVQRFSSPKPISDNLLKVPHMGWNRVHQHGDSAIWSGIDNPAWMYFVHSYYVQPDDPSIVAGSCQHGVNFAAVCVRDQLIGCQFHPEKSHAKGLQLLTNFVEKF